MAESWWASWELSRWILRRMCTFLYSSLWGIVHKKPFIQDYIVSFEVVITKTCDKFTSALSLGCCLSKFIKICTFRNPNQTCLPHEQEAESNGLPSNVVAFRVKLQRTIRDVEHFLLVTTNLSIKLLLKHFDSESDEIYQQPQSLILCREYTDLSNLLVP